MYRCEQCKQMQPPGVDSMKKVVEKRPQSYFNLVKKKDERGNEKLVEVRSTGWEIVKEITVCPTCAEA